MNANVTITVHGRDSADFGRKVEAIDAIARAPQEMPPGTIPPVILPPVDPPTPETPKPYFDVGDATGKAGDLVELEVEGGCRYPMNGFHIGGGCGKLDEPRSGYGLFTAVGAKLGPFLRNYLESEDLIHDEPNHQHDHFWSIFNMMKRGVPNQSNPLPEEWWEYAIGFFSLGQERVVPPTTIPSGTLIFTLQVKILEGTPPGEYEVTCLDEHYYRQGKTRRRDLLYSTNVDSEFASGGITKLALTGGKITVVA